MRKSAFELIVPPLTPFNQHQQIDEAGLRDQVNYVVETCNASVVIAAGVEAQEYSCLTLEERKALISRTLEYVDGRRPVYAGISHPSMHKALELAQHATRAGASGVQILAPLRPFGGAPSEKDLLNYFSGILQHLSLPVMLYLNAGPGADVSVETTLALAKLDGIHAIKESSRDLARVSRLIEQIDHAGHAAYHTTMQMLLISLELGGSGVTMPPPAAELGAKLIAAWQQGDVERARALQQQFSLFPGLWMKHGLTPVMKAALDYLGRSIGDPYPPYAALPAQERVTLEHFLQTSDLSRQEKHHA